MVDFNVRPSEAVISPLLQVKCMEFVRLSRGAGHEAVEHSWIVLNSRAKKYVTHFRFCLNKFITRQQIKSHYNIKCDKEIFL